MVSYAKQRLNPASAHPSSTLELVPLHPWALGAPAKNDSGKWDALDAFGAESAANVTAEFCKKSWVTSQGVENAKCIQSFLLTSTMAGSSLLQFLSVEMSAYCGQWHVLDVSV